MNKYFEYGIKEVHCFGNSDMELNDVPRNTQIQNPADSALLRFDEHNAICPDRSQQEHSIYPLACVTKLLNWKVYF